MPVYYAACCVKKGGDNVIIFTCIWIKKIFGIMHKTYYKKYIYENLLNSLPLIDRAELGRIWKEILIVYHLYLKKP